MEIVVCSLQLAPQVAKDKRVSHAERSELESSRSRSTTDNAATVENAAEDEKVETSGGDDEVKDSSVSDAG